MSGNTHRVVFIPGDGIGPEVAGAARRCLEATGVAFTWTECLAGESAIAKFGTPLPGRNGPLVPVG